MAVTIFEALQNADCNLKRPHALQQEIGKNQLHNAVVLLDKGYGIYDEVEPLLEKYGSVENVPQKAVV